MYVCTKVYRNSCMCHTITNVLEDWAYALKCGNSIVHIHTYLDFSKVFDHDQVLIYTFSFDLKHLTWLWAKMSNINFTSTVEV